MLRFTPLLLGAFVLLAACDSGDAIDPPTPADVAGTYDISALSFVPSSSGISTVNVLDTLVTAESTIRLLDSGQAQLDFRRRGGTARFVAGSIEVRARQVRLTFDAGSESTLARLVLPRVLTLDRDSTALTVSMNLTADLQAYDAARYGGLTAIPGRLTVGLQRR